MNEKNAVIKILAVRRSSSEIRNIVEETSIPFSEVGEKPPPSIRWR